MQQPPAAQDQTDPTQEAPEAEDQSGSTTIEIVIAQDGSITVEMETGAQESAESGGEGAEGDEQAPVQVKSIDEALDVARQMYQTTQQTSDQTDPNKKAQQSAGYGGV